MTTPTTISWFDYIKNWFNDLMARIDLSSPNVMHALVYASAGFLIGFFINRFFRSFIIGALLCAITIGTLHYLQVITIDIVQLKVVLGLSPEKSFESYITFLTEWIKTYPLFAVSGFIGFILGIKAG